MLLGMPALRRFVRAAQGGKKADMNELVRFDEPPQRLKLTTHDYRILDDAGAFQGRPQVELVEGVILTVSPQQNIHAIAKTELALRIAIKLKELDLPYRAIVEGTLELSPNTAVNPDVTIASERPTYTYMQPGNVALAIEIANTSGAFDTGEKAALYAAGGVPEYWVLLLGKKRLIRYWMPGDNGYQHRDEVALGEPFSSVTVPGLVTESVGLI
jgi:Uma2 family endonuclease